MTARIAAAVLAALVVPVAVAASAALAQGFGRGEGGPIEITSDSLEVVQADRIATFRGNVDAVQGDLVLSADELKVFYRGSGDPAPDGATGTIRRIEAAGSVVVTSPRESAEGESGTYDVTANLITLEGGVVLARGDNVIRGDQLELDLTTGVSRVVAATTASEGAPPERRVRAVFVPSDEEKSRRAKGERDQDRGARPGAARSRDAPADEGAPAVPVPAAKPASGAAADP